MYVFKRKIIDTSDSENITLMLFLHVHESSHKKTGNHVSFPALYLGRSTFGHWVFSVTVSVAFFTFSRKVLGWQLKIGHHRNYQYRIL
jgi:hypothetical protein